MTNERKYGLDILRIFSMFGIIGLHVVNNGGMLRSFEISGINYFIILIFTTIFYTSVNSFAMLSGYLYIEKKQNSVKNLINLLITVAFYCLLITAIFYSFNLFSIRNYGMKQLISSIVPPLVGRYWYITSYIVLFFMIPYINKFINNVSQKELKKLLILLFVLFSIIPSMSFMVDFFSIKNGYSPFWLIYCYMIGAYIKLYPIKKQYSKKSFFFILILIASTLNYFTKIISNLLLHKTIIDEWFINYISPFIVIASASLIIIFSNLIINNEKLKKYIKLFSLTSFAVYIIHSHILIYDFILKDLFYLKNHNIFFVVLILFGAIILIYLICSIIDLIRIKLFSLFKFDKIVEKMSKKFDNILY